MNTQNPNTDHEADLEGFETPEEDFDASPEDTSSQADDADFQDVSDDVDADVFGEEQPQEQPAKKKTNWFNIGVAVVAVAVAGGLIWTKLGPQLMGGGDTITAVSEAPANNPVATAVTKEGSEAAAQAAIGSGVGSGAVGAALLDNPDQFANLNQAPQPDAPAPIPAPDGDPFAALGGVQASPLPMPAPISGSPAPVLPNASEKAPLPQQTQDVVAAAAPQAAPVQETQSAPVQAAPMLQAEDSTALKAQVSALEQKMEALDSKLTAAVEQIGSAASASASVDDSRLSSIQSSLERLEARLDDLSSKRASEPRAVSANNDDVAPAPRKTSKKSSKTKASVPSRNKSEWDEPFSPPAAAVQPIASSGSSGGWELRGAQTGRAVIARGSDLREVSVGENVPGLGEITGVANMGGRWVVQGTQGRLSQ